MDNGSTIQTLWTTWNKPKVEDQWELLLTQEVLVNSIKALFQLCNKLPLLNQEPPRLVLNTDMLQEARWFTRDNPLRDQDQRLVINIKLGLLARAKSDHIKVKKIPRVDLANKPWRDLMKKLRICMELALSHKLNLFSLNLNPRLEVELVKAYSPHNRSNWKKWISIKTLKISMIFKLIKSLPLLKPRKKKMLLKMPLKRVIGLESFQKRLISSPLLLSKSQLLVKSVQCPAEPTFHLFKINSTKKRPLELNWKMNLKNLRRSAAKLPVSSHKWLKKRQKP